MSSSFEGSAPSLPSADKEVAHSKRKLLSCQGHLWRLDPSELSIFEALDKASSEGLTMPDLRQKVFGGAARTDLDSPEEAKTTQLISGLRVKLREFFRNEGQDLRVYCEIPTLMKGRGPRRRYRLLWKKRVFDQSIEVSAVHIQIDPTLTKLAMHKLHEDFYFSALRSREALESNLRSMLSSVEFLVKAGRARQIEQRITNDFGLLRVPQPTSPPQEPNAYIGEVCRDLVEYSKRHPIRINCGCFEVAAIGALRSMERKYNLHMEITEEDQSGRQQVVRLNGEDNPDFVVTANAPFFLLGEQHALQYTLLLPLHAADQMLLRKGRRVEGKAPTVLVYSDSSAMEEWLTISSGRPHSRMLEGESEWPPEIVADFSIAKPIFIDDLQRIVTRTLMLSEGDYVFAWQPLASGLMSRDSSLVPVGPGFHHWLSLYTHRTRWCSTDTARSLRLQFLSAFVYEWRTCNRFRSWAEQCLMRDDDFWYYFGGGAGLN